jgi:site-specific recombinase
MLRRQLVRLRRRGSIEEEAPELDRLLARAAAARGYAMRVEWVRDAVRWIEKDLSSPDDSADIARAHARVRFLLQLAERQTAAGDHLSGVLAGLLSDTDVEQLVATGGIPRRAGFIKEGYERLLAKLLPRPDYTHDAATLATGLLGRPQTIAWIDLLPAADAVRLAQLFHDEVSADRCRPQIARRCCARVRSTSRRPCVRDAAAVCEHQRARQPVRPSGRGGRGISRIDG